MEFLFIDIKQKRYGFEPKNENSTKNYNEQFERVIELRHSKGKLSAESLAKKKQKLRALTHSGVQKVAAPEIHGLLKLVYEREISEQTSRGDYLLIFSVLHFSFLFKLNINHNLRFL